MKKNNYSHNDDSLLEFKNLCSEEQKLFLITQFNTNLNREMMDVKEDYIKKGIIIFLMTSHNSI